MNMDLKSKWNNCLAKIRANVGEERFNTWFSMAEAVEFKEGTLVLRVPSRFYMEIFEDQFSSIIRSAVCSEFGSELSGLTYEYNYISNDNQSKVEIQSPNHSRIINSKLERSISNRPVEELSNNFDPQLNSALNFENYCVGHSNAVPHTIAEHIANFPEKHEFNPFFLYGNVGVGKTHLIQAIGIRIKERNPRARVIFVSMRQFQQLYARATMRREIPDFINFWQSMDCILFDDLQELEAKKGTAEVLFPIFNHLHQNNKKLIFTCDRAPRELDGIEDRLIDRFKWGITERLENPDYELRHRILDFKAKHNGLDISDDIIDLIARSTSGSVRELEGIVMGLYTRSIAENAPITVDLAQKVIGHFVKQVVKKSVNFDMIVENTAEFFRLNPDAIFSKCRQRDIVDARQVVMYLCKKHTDLSLPAIGAKLNRKHATVIHGIQAVANRLDYSREMKETLAEIEKSMLG